MNFTAENLSIPLFSETAKLEYLRAVPFHSFPFPYGGLHETWEQKIITDNGLESFILYGGKDILKEIGPISKEDYNYYKNL